MSLSDFGSSILRLYYLLSIQLGLLCLSGVLILVSLCPSLSLGHFFFFALKSTLSNVNIATPFKCNVYMILYLLRNFLHPFTFSIPVIEFEVSFF